MRARAEWALGQLRVERWSNGFLSERMDSEPAATYNAYPATSKNVKITMLTAFTLLSALIVLNMVLSHSNQD